VMAAVGVAFTRRSGWAYRPRRLAGSLLLAFGGLYLAVMVVRYAVRMSLYPPERWTGGSIPIFFHWVLAAWVLVVGWHHRRHGPRTVKRPWFRRVAWALGGTVAAVGLVAWVLYLPGPALLARAPDA